MMKAGRAVCPAHPCTWAERGRSLRVRGSTFVCHVYFALYFLLPHCSLDSRDNMSARAREEGRVLPCLQLTCWFAARELLWWKWRYAGQGTSFIYLIMCPNRT